MAASKMPNGKIIHGLGATVAVSIRRKLGRAFEVSNLIALAKSKTPA